MTYFSTFSPIPMDRMKSHPTLHYYYNTFAFSYTRHTHTLQMQMHDASVLCQPRNVTSHRKHITLIRVKCQLRSVCGHAFLHMRIHDTSVCLRPPDKHRTASKIERESAGKRLYYFIDCVFEPASLQLVYLRKAGRARGPLGPPSQRRIE